MKLEIIRQQHCSKFSRNSVLTVFIKIERNVKISWPTASTDPPSLPSPDVGMWRSPDVHHDGPVRSGQGGLEV